MLLLRSFDILIVYHFPEVLHSNVCPEVDEVVKLHRNNFNYQCVKVYANLRLVYVVVIRVKYSYAFKILIWH